MRSLSKAYSGFVHAASTQILNMYGGYPPRFHIHGMRGTPHEVDHRKDLWNYFYRGALAFHETTLMFGDFPLSNLIVEYYKEMQKHAGKAYGSHD